MVIVFEEGMNRANEGLFGASKNNRYLIVFDNCLYIFCDFKDDFFRGTLIFGVNIPKITDFQFGNVNLILRVNKRPYFFIEPSQTIRAIIFSTFVYCPFSNIVIWGSNQDNVSLISLLDQNI